MFEKEAEDKAFEKYSIPKVWNEIHYVTNKKYAEGFRDGAEFGYNKANEWHYVKNGDLPKNENRVLLYFGVDDYNDGQFVRGRFWCDCCGWFDVEEVIAWKEIIPPKE